MSSKLSVSAVRSSIKEVLADANGEKKRNFVETIELQIGLKNYDPQRDKRFSGTVKFVTFLFLQQTRLTFAVYRLPNVPRPRMSICILADAADIDRAKQIGLEYMSVNDLKSTAVISYGFGPPLNKNTGKKLVKKFVKEIQRLPCVRFIKQIHRLLGPG